MKKRTVATVLGGLLLAGMTGMMMTGSAAWAAGNAQAMDALPDGGETPPCCPGRSCGEIGQDAETGVGNPAILAAADKQPAKTAGGGEKAKAADAVKPKSKGEPVIKEVGGVKVCISHVLSPQIGAVIPPEARKPLPKEWFDALMDDRGPIVIKPEQKFLIQVPVSGNGARQLTLNRNGFIDTFDYIGMPCEAKKEQQSPLQVALVVRDGDKWVVSSPTLKAFQWEYPFGNWTFQPAGGVDVSLEAYSPMIPLNMKDSSLPVTIMEYTFVNNTESPKECALSAALLNFVGMMSGAFPDKPEHAQFGGNRVKTIGAGSDHAALVMDRDSSRAKQYTKEEVQAMEKAWGGSRKAVPGTLRANGAEGTLALMMPGEKADASADIAELASWRKMLESDGRVSGPSESQPSADGKTMYGALSSTFKLAPQQKKTVRLVLAWHFPRQGGGAMYASWFKDAGDVIAYMADNHERLTGETKLFRDTIFDSTLPWWLMDAVTAPLTSLRTATAHLTSEGWGLNEGCYCCPGNCHHVQGYVQTCAFLWPEMDRDLRITKLEWNLTEDGAITPLRLGIHGKFLGKGLIKPDELVSKIASAASIKYWYPDQPPPTQTNPSSTMGLDGMCGEMLAVYRAYLMSKDDSFLKRMWPRVKRIITNIHEYYDPDDNGLFEVPQQNTYDGSFYGPSPHVGIYWLAALRAGEEMATIMNEPDTLRTWKAWREKSRDAISKLFTGEFFMAQYGCSGSDDDSVEIRSQACVSDQMMGQWWADILNLGDLVPAEQITKSFKSIYKYNLMTDLNPTYIIVPDNIRKTGIGDKGLWNVSWTKGVVLRKTQTYMNDVWQGVEYEVAGGMLYRGLLDEGLTIARAAKERRYSDAPSLRSTTNPLDEQECGNYYVRPMSSYSLLTAAQGYHYNGPKRLLKFAPNITPENHKSFFVTADGWGSYSQKIEDGKWVVEIDVKWGEVELKDLQLGAIGEADAGNPTVTLAGKPVKVTVGREDGLVTVSFGDAVKISKDQRLRLTSGG